MEDIILEIDGLCKQYANFKLQDVSFSLPKGCIMGLIGENGAGKSTTLKLILGLLRKDAGSVNIFGQDMEKEGEAIKDGIGIVFADMNMPFSFHAKQVNQVLKRLYHNWEEEKFFRLLDRFGLRREMPIKKYSQGMRMKLNIIVAMCHQARLLILDEATSNLDSVVRDDILELLLEFVQDAEHSVLVSSHITSDLEKAADYITYIHQGKILFSEEKDRLLETYVMWKTTMEELQQVRAEYGIRYRENAFGVEALVRRDETTLPEEALLDRVTLDDIMLFYAKGKLLRAGKEEE